MNERITHFYYTVLPLMWKNVRTFLPFYRLTWSKDMSRKVCHDCPLAAYIHPLVQDKKKKNTYHLLCTVSVIRNGLLTLKEVFQDEGGCCRRNDDYQQAKEIFRSKPESVRVRELA